MDEETLFVPLDETSVCTTTKLDEIVLILFISTEVVSFHSNDTLGVVKVSYLLEILKELGNEDVVEELYSVDNTDTKVESEEVFNNIEELVAKSFLLELSPCKVKTPEVETIGAIDEAIFELVGAEDKTLTLEEYLDSIATDERREAVDVNVDENTFFELIRWNPDVVGTCVVKLEELDNVEPFLEKMDIDLVPWEAIEVNVGDGVICSALAVLSKDIVEVSRILEDNEVDVKEEEELNEKTELIEGLEE